MVITKGYEFIKWLCVYLSLVLLEKNGSETCFYIRNEVKHATNKVFVLLHTKYNRRGLVKKVLDIFKTTYTFFDKIYKLQQI